MTHIPVQLPFKGFTEQSQYSALPEGTTPSCMNVMPVDVFNGRMRIGTRQGTKRWQAEGAQFIGTYRVYEGAVLVERVILVRAGNIFVGDPHADPPSLTQVSNNTGNATPLNTTGIVEGVQFNEHFYFVDGTHYVFVHLTDVSGSGATEGAWIWGHETTTVRGPYHTDPSGAGNGDRATLICRWGARLVLAGYRKNPNIWFACSPGEPFPSSTSTTVADGWSANMIGAVGGIAGSVSTEFGTLGDPIVAIFPFGQTGLMFGCTNSFSFMTSDPEYDVNGAQMVALTKSIGIAGQRAWCFGQEKSAYVLAKDGLYLLNPNDFNFNRGNRISAGRLDSFFLRLDFGTPAIGGTSNLAGGTLRNVVSGDGSGVGAGSGTTILDGNGNIDSNPVSDAVDDPANTAALIGSLTAGDVFPCLIWDNDREGVWILLSVSGSEQSSLHLYYDAKTDSFWPQRFYDPLAYGPIGAVYVASSRSKDGKLFLAAEDGISTIDRSYPIGIDGFFSGITDAEQVAQLVRNSLTFGPIIAPLPYRLMLNEVRIDLCEDKYELPSTVTDKSVQPILSVSTGDTAQTAIGIQSDTLFVVQLNPVSIDCEDATPSTVTITFDGGNAATTPTTPVIDGRFAAKPFGLYSKANPFLSGTDVEYNGPSNYVLLYDVDDLWKIVWRGETDEPEYERTSSDTSPNGQYVGLIDTDIDGAAVSGASFSEATVTELATLTTGRNEAVKSRVRSEAMYLTVASDGRPWSVERMSIQVSQVGKSRGAVT